MNGLAVLQRGLITALALVLAACAGVQMVPGEPPPIRQSESMVVFMRSSVLGAAVAASVFDVTGPESKFVGIVNHGTKVPYPVKPGEYTFMVIGESADFMRATVLPERTYYALVTPRVGVWKARFSFRPLRQHELDGADFSGWDSATQFVANTPATESWATQNAADINSKRAQYWPEWLSKPAHQQASQTLNAEDGKPSAAVAAAPAAAVAPAAALPSSPIVPSDAGVEIVFWESIRSGNNPADFRAYLEQYPQGRFAALARNRLAALAGPPAAAAAAVVPKSSGPLPQAGDTWTYRLRQPKRADGPKERRYVVTVKSASTSTIFERYDVDGEAPAESEHRPGSYLVALAAPLFSPYLDALGPLSPSMRLGTVQILDGACSGQYACQARASVVGRETLKLAAGSFDTVKVLVEHSWRPAQQGGHPAQAANFNGARQMTIWYAPAAKRAVKYSSRLNFGAYPPVEADFDLELVSYKLQ